MREFIFYNLVDTPCRTWCKIVLKSLLVIIPKTHCSGQLCMEEFPANVVEVPAKLRYFHSSLVWHSGFCCLRQCFGQ